MAKSTTVRADASFALLRPKGVARLTAFDVDREIRRGLPIRALQAFRRDTGLGLDELAVVLDVSTKTIGRTIARNGRLGTAASDRLYRTARLVALADDVLEDRTVAREWLRTPQHGLGGRVPFHLLSTEAGAREVEALLLRIEHGFVA
jgi:putative toxin-antitoxin system antitoxin component (TIGR02293 family)